MTIAAYLQTVKMFAEMTDVELDALASAAERRELPADAVLFAEGADARELYVVERGRVAIEIDIHQGRRVQVASVEAGQGFGWSAFVPEEPATATARCTEPTTIIAFDVDRLEPMIRRDAHLGYVLLRAVVDMMSRRIRQTRMQLASLAYG